MTSDNDTAIASPFGNVHTMPVPIVAGNVMVRRSVDANVGCAEKAMAESTNVMPVSAGSAASSGNSATGDVRVPNALERLSAYVDAVAAPRKIPTSITRGRMPVLVATSPAALPDVVTVAVREML